MLGRGFEMVIPRLVQALTSPTIAFWASRTEKYEGFSKTKTALYLLSVKTATR